MQRMQSDKFLKKQYSPGMRKHNNNKHCYTKQYISIFEG